MNDYNDENIYNNVTGEDYTDELKFTNISTREYMNMMAERSGYYNGHYDDVSGQSFYNNDYTKSTTAEKNKVKNTGTGKVKKFFAKGVALVACGAIFGGVAGGVFHILTKNDRDDGKDISLGQTVTESQTTEAQLTYGSDYQIPGTTVMSDGQIDSMSLDVSDIAENVMPSVVSITIKAVTEYGGGFFGQSYEYESEGSGSGIIIGENDEELLIVTNNHVVSGATTVSVAFIDNEVYEAKVKGTDASSDLAIIVVDLEDISEETMSKIKIATIGNSDELKVGQQVVAIGNALGYGQSVTTGIVSAKERMNDTNTTPLIQTDAAINPGNSGGALLNMKGEVIGINSSKMASYDVEGMGYAIPITEVESIIGNLMNRETREKVAEEDRGYLGIACQTVSQEASVMYGIPAGVLVSEVSEKSAADKAGIKKNYVITSFDGQSVSSAEGLVDLLEYYEAGETVDVVVQYLDDDEYKEKTVSVTLRKAMN